MVEPDPERFFQEFLKEKKVGRVTRASAAAAASANANASGSVIGSASNGSGIGKGNSNGNLAVPPMRKTSKSSTGPLANLVPISSPDPLRILPVPNNGRTASLPTLNSLGLPTSQPSSIPPQRIQSQSQPQQNGSQRLLNTPPPSSDMINASSPLSSNLSSNQSDTSSTASFVGDFAVVIESPRKKLKKLSGTSSSQQVFNGNIHVGGIGETPARQVGKGGTGVESAVKRIRLVEGSIGTATYTGSAKAGDSKGALTSNIQFEFIEGYTDGLFYDQI